MERSSALSAEEVAIGAPESLQLDGGFVAGVFVVDGGFVVS